MIDTRHNTRCTIAASSPPGPAVRLAGVVVLSAAIMAAAPAQPAAAKSYDAQLMRLSEILGAVHYLRELCKGSDGQAWRRHMEDLIAAEGTSARRRALLARRFNLGYRNYARTYRSCSVSANAALDRFLSDANLRFTTGENGRRMIQENRGALRKTLEVLETLGISAK